MEPQLDVHTISAETEAPEPQADALPVILRSPTLFVAGTALFLVGWYLLYTHLEAGAALITAGLFGPINGRPFPSAVEFFIYEAPKVMMLLTLVVFGVGMVRSFFSPERTRRLLAGRNEYLGHVPAALLGIVTPFCSCSAVPLFIGFVTAGVPLGVTFAFLISAPMVNEIALALLFGLFGWKVAAWYLGTGLFIAVLSGIVISRLHMERHVEDWVYGITAGACDQACTPDSSMTWQERVLYGWSAVKDIVLKVWPYVLLGIAVGAGIHGYVPENLLAGLMGKDAWWSVPLAVLLGVPMYSNAAGIIPIVEALLSKGAALGTSLAFMMAVIGLSLPEVIILRKVLKPPLIAVFIGVVAVGIIFVGFFFNALL